MNESLAEIIIAAIDRVKSEGARLLVILSLVSVVIAVIWFVAASEETKGPVVWGPALVFAALAALFLMTAYLQFVMVRQVDRAISVVVSLREPKPPAYHIGCRIGRRRLECGLLRVTDKTQRLPADDRIVQTYEPQRRYAQHGAFQHDELYKLLVGAIVEEIRHASDQDNPHVDSVGLAVPGGVQPKAGKLGKAVRGMAFNDWEEVSKNLAEQIHAQCDPKLLKHVLGRDVPTRELASLIHVDNDARCAARWLITAHPEWQDFACVFAGSGVGSGLVFGKRVFYGHNFRAGEVGHVNLNPGDDLRLDGKRIEPRICSCDHYGYHFESLVSIGGLGHLARVVDPTKLEIIRTAYTADANRAHDLEAITIDPQDGDGMIILRVLDRERPVRLEGLSSEIDSYLANVARKYGQLFSVGITALFDSLDVDHVALCGTIPEVLRSNHDFTRALQRGVNNSLTGAGASSLEYGVMREWGWQGAAMLSRDPGYMAERQKSAA